jgi:NAD(P) transhydrogenase subunit beta
MQIAIQATYFIVAILFILGLRQMSSPRTARTGVIIAGIGMLAATLVTFFDPAIIDLTNVILIITAIFLGGAFAWISGKKVAMTNMPQMIAIYNGMGGGAAGAIAAIELLHGSHLTTSVLVLALAGAFIGTISFSGSLIAYAKLEGLIKRSFAFPLQQWINILFALAGIGLAAAIILYPSELLLVSVFFILLLLLGVTVTLPIGGANMPVVISLFNAMTGLAVAFEGFVLDNAAMIIAGTVVGASGSLLTQLMAKAMNQPIRNILFIAHTAGQADAEGTQGSMKPIEAADSAIMLNYAKKRDHHSWLRFGRGTSTT